MYEYATGLIRTIEKEITDQTDLNRMMEAPDIKVSFDALNDSDLKDNMLGIKPEEFEKAIEADNAQLKKFIKKFTDENHALYNLIFSDEDFFNLKLIFKKKILDIKFDKEEYSKLGAIKISVLKKAANNHSADTDNIDNCLAESIARIRKTVKKTEARRHIDTIIDKEYFRYATYLTDKIQSAVLSEFLHLKIDIVNIKSVLRAKKIGLTVQATERAMISGGNINTKCLIEKLEEKEESLIDFLKNQIIFSKQWDEIMEEYRANHNIVTAENKLNNFLYEFLKNEVKKISSGPEIVFYYAYLKKIATSNIRLIMTGKINNIPKEKIMDRLIIM